MKHGQPIIKLYLGNHSELDIGSLFPSITDTIIS